ncbi:MAG: hypothetical protein R3B72_52425 [Polyangiaceae bacterium]
MSDIVGSENVNPRGIEAEMVDARVGDLGRGVARPEKRTQKLANHGVVSECDRRSGRGDVIEPCTNPSHELTVPDLRPSAIVCCKRLLPSLLGVEPVDVARLDVRDLREGRIELGPRAARGAFLKVALGHERRDLLRDRGVDELVDRNALTFRESCELAMN